MFCLKTLNTAARRMSFDLVAGSRRDVLTHRGVINGGT
jgi:hypothetical protein